MVHIPPLAALSAFEATIRLGGFARAAAELNVSTSAVSHRIRALERDLGTRLLERSTGIGGIRVTPAGARLLPAVERALSVLEEACTGIKGIRNRLTVSANLPFSTMWLPRRLADFAKVHPDYSINAIIQPDEPDFSRHPIDLAIVYAPAKHIRTDDVVLLAEHVFPVCSPSLTPVTPDVFRRHRLLQEECEGSPELDWNNWASELDLPGDVEPRVIRYASFSQVIAAALDGAGLALGRSPLIDSELASGRLLRIEPFASRVASWRFVARSGVGRPHRLVAPLIEFLRTEAVGAEEIGLPGTGRSRGGDT
ncbi:LysR family transcriptional regulator [Methylobacterium sp. J-030]|uniref:LysR family transcriptional regulator n=1 Tax=Methylobacterium sp. J-030 TaxID=2836627 RepID=UPI001FBACC35|nr:LysR family transcriptional regulator [Methylobacterium sp. J-030]MCJ2070497.1 LysR family transcriptional regulator [Methylobacterium sp. J-030]